MVRSVAESDRFAWSRLWAANRMGMEHVVRKPAARGLYDRVATLTNYVRSDVALP